MGAQDEATFGLIPLIARGWAKKGSRPLATINYSNKCINVFGARSKKSFVYMFRKKKRQKEFVDFLERLQKKWGKVLLFVDNARAHHGKQVDDFLQRHKKTFRLEYFLPYTPELNPTEQCWKPGRRTLANRYLKDLTSMKYQLKKIFNSPKDMPKMFEYL